MGRKHSGQDKKLFIRLPMLLSGPIGNPCCYPPLVAKSIFLHSTSFLAITVSYDALGQGRQTAKTLCLPLQRMVCAGTRIGPPRKTSKKSQFVWSIGKLAWNGMQWGWEDLFLLIQTFPTLWGMMDFEFEKLYVLYCYRFQISWFPSYKILDFPSSRFLDFPDSPGSHRGVGARPQKVKTGKWILI